MPNAAEYISGSSQKILNVGYPGGGKSTLFGTLPGKKFLYIFDPNVLESIAGFDIDYELFIPDLVNMDAIPLSNKAAERAKPISQAKYPGTYDDFEEHFESHLQEGFFNQYDNVGFDSLSTLQDIVMDKIMFLNKRWGRHPEQADYTAAMATLLNIFRTLTNMQQTIYCTAHVETNQDRVTHKISEQIAAIGRLKNRIPMRFTEIWLAFADHEGDEQHYFVQTQQDKQYRFLRSSRRFRHLDFEEDVTIKDFSRPEEYGIGALLQRPIP